MDPSSLRSETGRCVKCGYCLPVCPTYRLTRNEADSPRGRIALIQGVMEGQIEPEAARMHLSRCLVCRACERACPSGVRYSAILTASRGAFPATAREPSWLIRLLLTQLPGLAYRAWGRKLLGLRPPKGLGRLLPRRWRRLLTLIPSPKEAISYPAGEWFPGQPGRPRIALFTGCMGPALDPGPIRDALALLSRLGVGVWVPTAQRCCGAIDHHRGRSDAAEGLMHTNLAAFNARPLDAILTLASGCGAHLATYEGRQAPVMDISLFLLQNGAPTLPLVPLPRRVTLHTPCSLRLQPAAAEAPQRLLALIPGIELAPLADDGQCCGGAGAYLLTEPELSDRLRAPKLTSLTASRAEVLATSNIGCALHLRAGAQDQGLPVEVLHPVELFARSALADRPS